MASFGHNWYINKGLGSYWGSTSPQYNCMESGDMFYINEMQDIYNYIHVMYVFYGFMKLLYAFEEDISADVISNYMYNLFFTD